MAINTLKRLRFLRGNTAAIGQFVGYSGELTINTDNWTIQVHDGVTPGGHQVADLGSVPTSLSDLANDAGYITLADLPVDLATLSDIESAVNAIVIPDTSQFITLDDLPAPVDLTGYALLTDIPEVPVDISELTDTQGLLGQGGGGTIQPYLELTNIPLISQPAVLGEPVTVTAAPQGIDARFTVVIGEGPTIDSITISAAGTGYTVGQRYRIWSYYIGGPDDVSSIEFEVATVGELGELLTITNAAFLPGASNFPGTYTNTAAELLASVFDTIDTGLTLTRGRNQGLYNSVSEQEYDNSDYTSPAGTEWNSEGWGDLLGLRERSYTTWRSALNNRVGNNIIGAELIMHDTINDKYYKFVFTTWGENNGAFAYTRTEVTDPNHFRKTDYGEEVDVIVADDGAGAGIGITRGNNNSIFNPYREEGYNQSTSPAGTLWNIDGWDDLSNVETRTYSAFYAAYNGNLGNRVPGSKAVMYVPETGKYYAVGWSSWTQNGNGGGFSYSRREIDLSKLNEGIKFADGTTLTSATGLGRIKSTAPAERRIEEVSGSKEVTVTQVISTTYNSTSSRTTSNNYEIFINRTAELDAVLTPIHNGSGSARLEVSFDGTTFAPVWLATINDTEYWLYYDPTDSYVPQVQGNPVYVKALTGGDPVIWWNKNELPSGGTNFRGAVIDYHALLNTGTIIGTIHIADDNGNDLITHTEVKSGWEEGLSNEDLWYVTQEGQIRYRRLNEDSGRLKVHWIAKVFYGSETYD